MEVMAMILWGFVNVTVSSYSSDISCAGIGPMTGTISSKSWNALLMKTKMAARSDAAAAPGPKDGAFMSFNVVCSSQNIVDLQPIHKEFSPEHIYDRQSLLDIGNTYLHQLSPEAAEKLQGLCLLLKPNLETAASPTDATRTRRRHKRCERGRKRGKRRGI